MKPKIIDFGTYINKFNEIMKTKIVDYIWLWFLKNWFGSKLAMKITYIYFGTYKNNKNKQKMT